MLLPSIYSWGNQSSENLRYCPRSFIPKPNKYAHAGSHETICCLHIHHSSHGPWTGGVFLPASHLCSVLFCSCICSWQRAVVLSPAVLGWAPPMNVRSFPSHSLKLEHRDLNSCSYCLGKGTVVVTLVLFGSTPSFARRFSPLPSISFSLLSSPPPQLLPFLPLPASVRLTLFKVSLRRWNLSLWSPTSHASLFRLEKPSAV